MIDVNMSTINIMIAVDVETAQSTASGQTITQGLYMIDTTGYEGTSEGGKEFAARFAEAKGAFSILHGTAITYASALAASGADVVVQDLLELLEESS